MSAAGDGTSPNAWSEPTNGVSGRMRVELEEVDSGLRHAVHLELRNETSSPVSVTNLPVVDASLRDAGGHLLEASDPMVSGPEPTRRWMVVPPDAYLGFRIDMRTLGMPAAGSGVALLALGGRAWRLAAGRCELRAIAAFPRAPDGPAEQWVGELELPPVTVVIQPESVAATGL